ncbi:MAG: response regulator [Clostridiales Family XIII bacterium]|jgi:signal transduction histidine kinase/ActR/RegA family two-component response regulator|nr:response regulator [Clostridiales Family XIII bacterium]
MNNGIKTFGKRIGDGLDAWMDRRGFSIRTRLIIVFLVVKIVPIVVLLLIAWSQFTLLGEEIKAHTDRLATEMTQTLETSGDIAVTDASTALNASATEQIERITTDIASSVADFLYGRDEHIRYLSLIEPTEENYSEFIHSMTGRVTAKGEWALAEDGMSWVRVDSPDPQAAGDVSTNSENNDEVNGGSFHYRPADSVTYSDVPLYDEIAFIGTDLQEKIKVVAEDSTKVHHPFDPELKDISVKANTYTGAETYGEELLGLKPGEIYVSDVVGEYVPSHFIGMYTPKQMAVSAVNAEITALGALDPAPDEAAGLTERLTEIKTNGIKGIEAGVSDEQAHLKAVTGGVQALLDAAYDGVTDSALTERGNALKQKIAGFTFDPKNEAYAGVENPNGIRFEGIVRWATPVTDAGENIIGYVSFALNHDHIMEFVDHVTPMNERYTELPNAFDGNYAFIWDYQCRNICHPRHHSIVGYDPGTGLEQIPWIESSIYDELQSRISGDGSLTDLQENWTELVNEPQTPDASYSGVDDLLKDVPVFDAQSRTKKATPALTAAGLVGLDGRYLNTAPQCTGWMDLTKDGGSGSFYILWSGLYKLTTAGAIPYYTGQYAPSAENDFSRRGFAMVTVGAGLEDFQRPVVETSEKLDISIKDANDAILESSEETRQSIEDNMRQTTFQLILTTAIIIVLVVFIAIWLASFVANNIGYLIAGVNQFRMGNRRFRFHTERKDEFGELADSFDDMAASIEESVTSPLSITDNDLNIIYMNDAGLEATNMPADEIVGKSYKEYSIYPFGTEFCPIKLIGEDRESAIYFNERNCRYYQGAARPLLDKDGNRSGYIITSTDMTDVSLNRFQLEQAVEEANKANMHKSEFLARMSHEIRTPMNAIIGVANIAGKKLESSADATPILNEMKSHISQIENSSQHLLGLLNDILELSNIEVGKIKIEEEAASLRKLMDTVQDVIRPRSEEKHITFETEYDDALPYVVMVDPYRLKQVLYNLLGNAVKFTPEDGRIVLRTESKGQTADTVSVRFSVADTGIGLDKEAMESIFDAFEQGDGSATRRYGGVGLGLPISRSIVRLMGGDIEIDSRPGEGSTFSFVLNLKTIFSEEKSKEEAPNTIDLTGTRILVVDDVDINRMIVASLLEDTGVEIIEAEDGKEALEVFISSEPGSIAAIFMDLMMPVMGGLESVEAIRALDRPDAKTVPIIALTANAFKEDVERALAAGMNEHMAKPIDPDDLIAVIYRYLGKKL